MFRVWLFSSARRWSSERERAEDGRRIFVTFAATDDDDGVLIIILNRGV